MGYNTSVHETTGHTPFELTFGRTANMPSTIATTPTITQKQLFKLWKTRHDNYIKRARETTERNKQRYFRDQQRKIIKTQAIFNQNDLVLLHNDHKAHKLDHEWLEPFRILEANTRNYTINFKGKSNKVQGNRLKIYIPGRYGSPQPSTSQ